MLTQTSDVASAAGRIRNDKQAREEFFMNAALDQRLVRIVPSERQLRHQELEFYAFIHFTVNTFTGREWGDGTESPSIFRPDSLNADQWAEAVREAGMKGMILTCKHHDGFCLWPSRYTDHTVAASPFRNGRGDIVREASDACRRAGLAFGVYLSPWDRHNPLYGTGTPYDDYFVHQLEELLTGYGEIFCVWFDGACGEGPNGKKQFYDWDRYYETVRRLQPNACISVCGPDVRWCGNEAGVTRPSEWSVVPKRTRDTEKIAADSQQEDSDEFRQRKISASDLDLGSQAVLENEPELIWYPAEVNTSIRPGWFYHAEEDGQVKPLEQLVSIYENAAGGNATFLLNIPPDTDGLLHKEDVTRLRELGQYLRETYAVNLLSGASLSCGEELPEHPIEAVREDSYDTWFQPRDGVRTCRLAMTWPENVQPRRMVLKENIRLSQRIERFSVEAKIDGAWQTVYRGTTVGHKKIVPLTLPPVRELALCIEDARVCPTLSFLGVY